MLGPALNTTATRANQGRHIVINIIGAVGEGGLYDNRCRIYKITDNLVVNRLVVRHEGWEAVEVKLHVDEGFRVEHEERTDITDVGAQASVGKKKLIVLLTIRIIMIHLYVVIYTGDDDLVIIGGGRVLTCKIHTEDDRGHLDCYDDNRGGGGRNFSDASP